MRPRDADKLKAHYGWWGGEGASEEMQENKKTFDTIIGLQPTLDAELIRHWEWISVEERLPKEEEDVYWCYTDAGVMCECRWTDNRFGLGHCGLWGWHAMDVPQYQRVTHWMPLPKPPTDEKEE